MQTRQLARVRVPAIGQGTWNLERAGRDDAVAALRRGLDAGLSHVDTAELYGDGEVERIVGEALRGRRDEVFLVSKVLPQNASRAGTIAACERSLRRLGTERLDLYLLHWPGAHPLAETIAGFEELVERGAILAYGVSNFDADELDGAVALAGPGRIACNQVLYHLQERAIEHSVLPRCEELGIAVVGYSPFGSGDFPDPRSAGGAVLAEVAAELGATPRQVALAFLTRRASLAAIPQSARIDHVLENAAAGELELGSHACARIAAAFPLGPPPRHLPVI